MLTVSLHTKWCVSGVSSSQVTHRAAAATSVCTGGMLTRFASTQASQLRLLHAVCGHEALQGSDRAASDDVKTCCLV